MEAGIGNVNFYVMLTDSYCIVCVPVLLTGSVPVCIEALQYPYQICIHNETDQNIQMLRANVDPQYTASIVPSSFCPYLCLSFCLCHLFLSPSCCLLNLHPPETRKQYMDIEDGCLS